MLTSVHLSRASIAFIGMQSSWTLLCWMWQVGLRCTRPWTNLGVQRGSRLFLRALTVWMEGSPVTLRGNPYSSFGGCGTRSRPSRHPRRHVSLEIPAHSRRQAPSRRRG